MSHHNDSAFGLVFLFGLFIGIVLSIAIITTFPLTPWVKAVKAIKECELTIPRNQNCVLMAKPQEHSDDLE